MKTKPDVATASSPLFDLGLPTRPGPAKYGEPSFPYLNTSARPSFAAVRELLERWFTAYPSAHQAELRQRFRSARDKHHQGAFFELYLHALLTRLGFQVLVHPAVPSSGSRPDYLLDRAGRGLAYVEGTVANASGEDAGAEARKERVHRTLNEITHANFLLGVRVDQVSARDVSRDLLVEPVRAWLDTLDPDAPPPADTRVRWARKTLKGPDWRIIVEAIPRRAEMRGTPLAGGIGTVGPYGGWINPAQAVRSALRAKARQFPRLELPLVVAMNCHDYHVDNDVLTSTLFGSPQVTIARGADGSETVRDGRAANGAWWRGTPAGRRVSAAVFVRHLDPWTVARVQPVLWIHPWAEAPFPADEWPLAAYVPDHMVERPSQMAPVGELFGLPDGWPGPD